MRARLAKWERRAAQRLDERPQCECTRCLGDTMALSMRLINHGKEDVGEKQEQELVSQKARGPRDGGGNQLPPGGCACCLPCSQEQGRGGGCQGKEKGELDWR